MPFVCVLPFALSDVDFFSPLRVFKIWNSLRLHYIFFFLVFVHLLMRENTECTVTRNWLQHLFMACIPWANVFVVGIAFVRDFELFLSRSFRSTLTKAYWFKLIFRGQTILIKNWLLLHNILISIRCQKCRPIDIDNHQLDAQIKLKYFHRQIRRISPEFHILYLLDSFIYPDHFIVIHNLWIRSKE